tara:strand:- start:715 stop:1401 length:687 start_codon:yes stop_codon:yes gene_type:complete
MKFNKKLIWYSLPILVGGFLIYKQFTRGKKQGQDVPPPPPPTPSPDPIGGGSVSTYPLRKGSKNSTVGSLQSLLNTALACQNKTLLVVDDNFGSKTETALNSLTGKTSIANSADFEAVKKQLASTCSKSSNLSWVWKLIDAQNTGKYSYLVVSQPIQFYKVVKDFRGLWIQAVPASGLLLNPSNYSLKDYVLRSASTEGGLRLEVMIGEFKGMWMSKAGSNLTTLNVS